MPNRVLVAVFLAFAGAGVGALVAHFSGVASWLDAKMHLVLGTAIGLAVAEGLDKLWRRRSE